MRRGRRTAAAELTGVFAVGLGVLAASCCVWAWLAYSYLFGTSVAVHIDTNCLAPLQDERAEMLVCADSEWTAHGVEHQGDLIDYGQTSGPFEFDAVRAKAVGDTAGRAPRYASMSPGGFVNHRLIYPLAQRGPRISRFTHDLLVK